MFCNSWINCFRTAVISTPTPRRFVVLFVLLLLLLLLLLLITFVPTTLFLFVLLDCCSCRPPRPLSPPPPELKIPKRVVVAAAVEPINRPAADFGVTKACVVVIVVDTATNINSISISIAVVVARDERNNSIIGNVIVYLFFSFFFLLNQMVSRTNFDETTKPNLSLSLSVCLSSWTVFNLIWNYDYVECPVIKYWMIIDISSLNRILFFVS